MYTEFVIGYVLSGLAIFLLAIVIVLQCIILKKMARSGGSRAQDTAYNPYSMGSAYSGSRGTAICRNCATQFDAAHTICPKCGTPR